MRETVVAKVVEHEALAPARSVIGECAGACAGQRCAGQRRLQLTQQQGAADLHPLEQQGRGFVPTQITGGVERSTGAIEVASDARTLQAHPAGGREAGVEVHAAGHADAVEVERITARAVAVEPRRQARLIGSDVAVDPRADQAHFADRAKAGGEDHVTADVGTVGNQRAGARWRGVGARAELGPLAVEVTQYLRVRQTHFTVHAATRVQRQLADDQAAFGAQPRQRTIGQADAAGDARRVEQQRGVEDAAVEPQADRHRGVDQVDAADDPRAEHLDAAAARARAGRAAAGEEVDELGAQRHVGRRGTRPLVTELGDAAAAAGIEQHLLGLAQRLEVPQYRFCRPGLGQAVRCCGGRRHRRGAAYFSAL